MQIEHAICITKLIKDILKVRATGVPLRLLENSFIRSGLEEGSFNIIRVTYSDDTSDIYFHYPTDMIDAQAEEFAKSALIKFTEDIAK
jgi:hypothetical protein